MADETERVAMKWPVALKEAVRDRVGQRGLTGFTLDAVREKLATHDGVQVTERELNEVRDLAQRMVDAIVRFGPEEDTLSVIQELELPSWIDTTGWPEQYTLAVARDEPVAEAVGQPAWEESPEDEDLHRPMFMSGTPKATPEPIVAGEQVTAEDNVIVEEDGHKPDITTPEGVSNSFLERVRAKAAEKGVKIDPDALKPASAIEPPTEKPEQPTRHNHAFERTDGVLCCSCGAWIDDSEPPGVLREADWKPDVVPEEPIEPPAPVEAPAVEACSACGSVECWGCF